MAKNVWKTLEMIGYGLNWLEIVERAGTGWKWIEMAGHGCIWLELTRITKNC